MTNDLAALAANDQFSAELTERVNRATIDAAAIAGFYRCVKADGLPVAICNALTHKFADWYFAAVEDWVDDDN